MITRFKKQHEYLWPLGRTFWVDQGAGCHKIDVLVKLRLFIGLFALISLGCSAGAFLVRAPTPTPTPTKTPRPIFTPTLIPTETPLPTDTPTITPIPTETSTTTPTLIPSEIPTETSLPTNTSPPPSTRPPAPPPPPTATPAPTATPEPSYPFPAVVSTHPTGSQFEFRITAFIWEGNPATGQGQNLHGYQFKVVRPTGQEGLSNLSGGGNPSTQGGDAHFMNFEYKVSPYTPGVYKVTLMKDGVQMAPTVDVVAQVEPFTYAHVDFIRQK